MTRTHLICIRHAADELINQRTNPVCVSIRTHSVVLEYALTIFITQNKSRLFLWLMYATVVSILHADVVNIKSIWLS